MLGAILGGGLAGGLGVPPLFAEYLGSEYFPKAVDAVEGWIGEDEANEKRREEEAAEAKAEADRLARAEEQKAIDRRAAAQAYLDQAMAEPVPMYSEDDYEREEAEITRAARKAMGDALIMAGEQASAMGLPVGTAQAAQANVAADVSAKQSLAKAHRFAQMRVQNMEHLMHQYNNKHRALLVSAGMEQDASRRAELFRQATIMQQMGTAASKELNLFLAELGERSWWEKALDPVGAFAGQFAGEAGGEMGKAAVATLFSSDARLKTEIRETGGRYGVRGIKEYRWKWNSTAKRLYGLTGKAVGVIAQEVEKVLPRAVVEEAVHGYLMVDYGLLGGVSNG